MCYFSKYCIMRRLQFLLCLILLISITSCYEYFDNFFCIDGNNNSDYDVWFSHVMPYYHQSEDLEYIEIDKHRGGRVIYVNKEFVKIDKQSKSVIFEELAKNGGWKWIKRHLYPDSLRIQVWDDALIQKVGWEEFVKNMGTKYRYELEYVLDIDDLEKINYRVTYPPSGAIEQMRIVYPD